MAGRGAAPGERRGGRRKGTPNKVTKEVKEAVLEALNADSGATAFFKKLKNGDAQDQRTFATICARLLPKEVTGAGGAPLIPADRWTSNLDVARRLVYILRKAEQEADDQQKEHD